MIAPHTDPSLCWMEMCVLNIEDFRVFICVTMCHLVQKGLHRGSEKVLEGSVPRKCLILLSKQQNVPAETLSNLQDQD